MHSLNQTVRKWRWPIILCAVAVVWSMWPTLVGRMIAPKGYALVGTSAMNPTDAVVYESYIQQGRHGSWWMHDAFTSEVTAPTLWQPLWWIVGRTAQFFFFSNATAYFLTRIVGAIVVTLTLWWATGWLWDDWRRRVLGSVLVLFGGGVGWMWASISHPAIFVTASPDLWVAEMYPALSLLGSPHFLFVTAGLIAMFVGVERYAESGKIRYALLAIGAGIVVFSLHPFHIITMLAVWSALTFWRWLWRQPLKEFFRAWVAVVCTSAPIIFLFGAQVLSDPLAHDRALQNVALTWFWPLTISALGVFFVLATRSRAKQWATQAQWQWLVTWAAIGLMVVFLPFAFQRRLSQGLFVPFALLALPILDAWWRTFETVRKQVVIIVATLLVLFASGIVSSGAIVRGYMDELQGGNAFNYYLSPEQQAIYRRIAEDGNPSHVVLASITTSQFVPELTSHNVYIGHSVETLHFSEKTKNLRSFFGSMLQPNQAQFISDKHICWIIYGPRERGYGDAFHPANWSDLKTIYIGPTTTLLQTSTCL